STLQPSESWQTFRPWLERVNPRMQFNVARGLTLGGMCAAGERYWADLMRMEARARMAWLLPPGTILCLPTTPFPAPAKGLPLGVLEPLRARLTARAAHGAP